MAYTWSERTTVDTLTADAEAVASVLCGDAHTELLVSSGGLVQIVPAGSLDGSWGAPVTLQTNASPPVDLTDVEACGVPFGNRLCFVSVGGGTVRFWVFSQGTWWQVGSVVNVYEPFGSARFPALAVHPYNWRFFVATWHGAKTILSTSPDRGTTWHDGHDLEGTVWVADVDDLEYPALCCGRDVLWMAGWLEGTYHGAAGQLTLYRYKADAPLESAGDPVVIGAADECRAAITRRPGTGELIVVAAKTGTAWDDVAGSDKGIVEYRSVDSGATWALEGFHEVT